MMAAIADLTGARRVEVSPLDLPSYLYTNIPIYLDTIGFEFMQPYARVLVGASSLTPPAESQELT